MLFGDGIITPAVSVLSSVEGLGRRDARRATVHRADRGRHSRRALPRAAARHAAHRRDLRPGHAGLVRHDRRARSLGIVALSGRALGLRPVYSSASSRITVLAGIAIFGAIVLCVSGVEALYADMSHFGRGPIALAWSTVVFPALASTTSAKERSCLPIRRLAIRSIARAAGALPGRRLATVATIIASQALDLGRLHADETGHQLGFIPRTRVVYTSIVHRGQVYVPFVNRLLAVACIALVVGVPQLHAPGQRLRPRGRGDDDRHLDRLFRGRAHEVPLEPAQAG